MSDTAPSPVDPSTWSAGETVTAQLVSSGTTERTVTLDRPPVQLLTGSDGRRVVMLWPDGVPVYADTIRLAGAPRPAAGR